MKQCNILLSPLLLLTAGTVFASLAADNNIVPSQRIVYKEGIAYQRADQAFSGSAVRYCIRNENNQKTVTDNAEHYYEFHDGELNGKAIDYDCHNGLITEIRHYKGNKRYGWTIRFAWPGMPYVITWYDNDHLSPVPENKKLTPDDFSPVYYQKSDNTINVNTVASLDYLFYQVAPASFTGTAAEYCVVYDESENKSEDNTKIKLTTEYKNNLKDGKETDYNCGDGKVTDIQTTGRA